MAGSECDRLLVEAYRSLQGINQYDILTPCYSSKQAAMASIKERLGIGRPQYEDGNPDFDNATLSHTPICLDNR